MKASIDWLKEYVAVGIPAETLIHRLTMAGLEVERVEKKGGDTVFEMEITPNRPDCLSMIGIAREVSAILNKPLKKPVSRISFPQKKTNIVVKDKKACPRYIGIVVEGVKVAPSPKWLRKRIEALGLRSINNVVDITNFCLMEWGQPLHAFDYDKLRGNKIVVRRAEKNEKITTLDGVRRVLGPEELVIADDKKPVALAGVMGGENTEVISSTKNILLESASFDPVLIRRTARALGLASDSSYRFERGIDDGLVKQGALRAVSFILKEAGGRVTAYRDTDSGKRKTAARKFSVGQEQINNLLGAPVPSARCRTILKKLEFAVTGTGKNLKVTVPSFRNDVREPVDVIEEIARIVGYDNLPSSIPQIKAVNVAQDPRWENRVKIREIAVGLGLDEIITYTMTNKGALESARQGSLKGVEVVNPISQDHEMMRPSTLPNILDVVLTNINRGQRDFRLFELGKIFSKNGERETLSVVMTGPRARNWTNQRSGLLNFYDIKGVVEALLERLSVGASWEAAEDDTFEPGRCARVKVGGKPAGILGAVHPDVLKNHSIKHNHLLYAQFDLETVYPLVREAGRYRPISGYPPMTRDVSIAVDKNIFFADIVDGIEKRAAELLKDIVFIEEYLGEKIAEGQRGVVFSLIYQSTKRTLTEDEVQKVHDSILDDITARTGAVVR